MTAHIGRITKPEKAKKSAEHLAMLHRDYEPESSHTKIEADKPVARNVRRMLPYAGERSGGEAGGLSPLNLNDFIREAVQRTVAKKVRLRAVPADSDVRVMADSEEMSRVLAALVAYGSEIIRKGGTITILARMLPIENALLERGGCALLSVSSTDVDRSCRGADRIGRRSVRRAFRAIRSVIRGYNGSVRVLRQQGKTAFNIYLPVLHDGTLQRFDLLSAVAGREEAAWRQ